MKMIASAAVFVIMSLFFVVSTESTPFEQVDKVGEVTIQVIDEFGDIVINDTHSFTDIDTLYSLLEDHYTVEYSNVSLGRILLGIENVNTDFERDFLQIRITGKLFMPDGSTLNLDNAPSPVGIDRIPLVDGNTYIFKYQRIGN